LASKNEPNSISTGAPPQTPLGELTTLPQSPYTVGEGISPLQTPPLNAFGISISAPLTPRNLSPSATRSMFPTDSNAALWTNNHKRLVVAEFGLLCCRWDELQVAPQMCYVTV